MTSPLGLLLLGVTAFGLATTLEPWFQTWAGSRTASGSALQVALGDGRRLFARHAYARADAYFHNGYYPSIYDGHDGYEKAHIADGLHELEGANGAEREADFLGQPRDWIERFSRHFFPSVHRHLGEATSCQHCEHGHGENHDHGHGHDQDSGDPGHAGGQEREILPWLQLSARLDPQHIETYVVGAFWLRKALQRSHEAERLLREGLQANPGSHEILFELGRIYFEDRQDAARARNVWELALAGWRKHEPGRKEPNELLRMQLLGNLARLEEQAGNVTRALEYLEELLTVSPSKDAVRKWIDDLRAKAPQP
ncbi:MAG TPA: hypothetical protein VNO52_16800 [Methylomirabilota bacterium]|nr:hypothetical protein [Methylomirabilota bacterium]